MNDTDIYLIYLRKSRADNPDETIEEVLARHERQLQELSVKNFGKPIEEKYIFREVVSGETIEDRPEIKKLLLMIEDPNVKGILVIEPQRLSRGDWEDGGKILSSFKYSNTLIMTPHKTYDLRNKFDYKFFKMELSQGNDYLEYVKEILNRGRLASVKEGNYIGSIAPYGWQKIFNDKSPTLEEYEPESKVIKIAVKLRMENNWGWTKVAHEVDRMGFKPRNGDHWSPYTLRDICCNPINDGKVKWNSRKEEKIYEDGKLKVTRPRNKKEVIYVNGKHKAMFDHETFEKLIAMESNSTREKTSTTLVNPFAGLIFCATCGKAMSYRTYKNKDGTLKSSPRLLCNNQVHCNTKSSTFEDIYTSVINTLEAIVNDFEMQLKDDQSQTMFDYQSKLLSGYLKDLENLEKKQDELYDLLEDGIYTKEVFLKRNNKLDEERQSLYKQINYLKENAVEPINFEEKIMMFSDVIKALKDPFVSAKEKNIMLKSIIKRIEYSRDSTNRTKWDTSKPILKITIKDF